MKKRSLPDIGCVRRKQIVEAAVAVIAEKGLQHCSLSEIEKRAGMCRGQLTYYFPTKEEILLAVFDHLLQLMHQRAHGDCVSAEVPTEAGWERFRYFLTLLVLEPPAAPEFHSLQYTFLSQIGHREDFRRRLADLYEDWRGHIAQDCAAALTQRPDAVGVSARTVATLVQAILHGLAMQRAADPESYDPEEMLKLCLNLLGNCLEPQANSIRAGQRPHKPRVLANGSSATVPARRSSSRRRA